MGNIRRQRKASLAIGFLFLVLFLIACSKAEKAVAPAPAAQPAQAAPSPAAAPAPVAKPAPAAPATTPPALTASEVFASRQVPGGPKVDPAAWEKDKGLQTILKYHATKLPLWTKAKYGGEMTFALNWTPSTALNPVRFFSLQRNAYYGMLLYYDHGRCSMQGRDENFSVCKGQQASNDTVVLVPGIIQRWEQPDPLTYVFHIRKGVLWSAVPPMLRTDREVTSQDVVWYWDLIRREGILRDNFALVNALEAPDRYTVKVTMQSPHADFLRNLGVSALGFFPKECYDENDCLGTKLVTAGPWTMKESVARQKVVFERNPEFFLKGLPYVDRWTWINITDPSAQKSAFTTGQAASYRASSETEALSVAKTVPGSQIHLQACTECMWGFRPRLQGPLADARVRRAMMLALDLPASWQLVTEGVGSVPTVVPRDMYGFGKAFYLTLDQAGPWYQYNPEKAKQLLLEAGYPNGFKTKIVTTTASGSTAEYNLYAQQMWKRNLNIDVDIQVADGLTVGALRDERKWEGMLNAGCWIPTCWSDGDSAFLQMLKGSRQNFQDLDDPVINDLYLKQRGELDPAKRVALLWQFEQHDLNMIYLMRLNVLITYDLMQPYEMNGASHGVNYYWSLGSAWLTMVDPEKAKK